MCGIVGSYDLSGTRTIDESLLRRMSDAQSHRGPDQDGVHIEPGVGLAHRRLSIIDLGNGRQPLYNEDDTVVVVYNGEIYNFQELRKELQTVGHIFKTSCDTEVIVHGWEEWGERCVERLRGMFAFALWDKNTQTLFMARDRIGIKPLYYGHTTTGIFLFGSELKALLVHPDIARDIDPESIEDYFALGYVPDPRSIYRSIRKLEPGYTLTLKRSRTTAKPTLRQYWDLQFSDDVRSDNASVRGELIEQLTEAVRIRMIADVPLGAFLSGGVDSSAVVALMAGASEEAVNTCSISFPVPEFDESRYAQIVADRYSSIHHSEQVDPDDVDLLDTLVSVYDEPFADSSAIPTYRVCESARKRVVVALSGDGGDEGFAGYSRYRWHMREHSIRRWLPQSVRGPLFGTLGQLYPKIDWAPKPFRAKSTLQALARKTVEAYFHNFTLIPDAPRFALYTDQFCRELDGYRAVEVFNRHVEKAPTDPLSQVQYLDFKTYLPGDILTKVDRASMAHSLEVRVPILDHKFVDWHTKLAPHLKLRNFEGKYLLKKSLEPYLPNEILYRSKMGFAVPLASWFRGPLRERVRTSLLGESLADRAIFDRKRLTEIVDDHLVGRRDNSAAIWALLMFEGFLRGEPQSSVR